VAVVIDKTGMTNFRSSASERLKPARTFGYEKEKGDPYQMKGAENGKMSLGGRTGRGMMGILFDWKIQRQLDS
jgi:hypothetical protein